MMSQIPLATAHTEMSFVTVASLFNGIWQSSRRRAQSVTDTHVFVTVFLLIGLFGVNNAFGRTIVNGDILYVGEATAASEVEAGFLAEAQAVRALLVECSLPHKEIRIWEKKIERSLEGYHAKATAGLNFESCEEAKTSNQERRSRLTNPILAEDQAAFRDHLASKLSLTEKPFDLKGFLDRKFNRLNIRLDAIEESVQSLQQGPTPSQQVVIIQPATPKIQANDQECRRNIRRLMQKAEVAALKNKPAGNLAQGEALEYYNLAMDESRYCN